MILAACVAPVGPAVLGAVVYIFWENSQKSYVTALDGLVVFGIFWLLQFTPLLGLVLALREVLP